MLFHTAFRLLWVFLYPGGRPQAGGLAPLFGFQNANPSRSRKYASKKSVNVATNGGKAS